MTANGNSPILKIKRAVASIVSMLPKGIFLDKKLFDIWEKCGVHVTPVHFYSPMPSVFELNDDVFSKELPLEELGVDMRAEEQLERLKRFSLLFANEYNFLPREEKDKENAYDYFPNNDQYASVDGESLYAMVRDVKPARMIEIGSGNSTRLTAKALLKNKEDVGVDCDYTAIEPYPNDIIKAGFPGLTRHLEEKVENVNLSIFDALQAGDILVVDSSHALRIGGDVQRIFMEIIPRLNDGVIIHVHDIFFPFDYPRDWIKEDHLFWTEQYLLQAFLAFNNKYQVLWCGSYLHFKHADALSQAIESYDPQTTIPKSFWMKKI